MKWKDIGITKVIIEEPLLSSNNKYTVSTLLRFNGMISESCYEVLGVVPEYISSYDARQYSFPILMDVRKYGKNSEEYPKSKILKSLKDGKISLFGNYPWDVEKKHVLHGMVSEIFPDIQWVYDKKGELKKENFDSSDAYVATLGFLNKERYGELKFNVCNIENIDNTINYTIKYWDKSIDKSIKIHNANN